jgi:UrcA family protein
MEFVTQTHELKMSHTRLTLLAVGASLLVVIGPPAVAQTVVLRPGFSTDPTDSTKIVREAVIRLSDIDPQSPGGAQTLLQRIEEAADAVCGGAVNAVGDRQKEGYDTCRRRAISGAVAKMRSPALTALTRQTPPRIER